MQLRNLKYKIVYSLMRKFQDLEHQLKDKPHPFKLMKPDHVITPTFVIDGKQHWTLCDTFNTASMRMASAINVLDEWQNRMDNKTLKMFIQALKSELSQKEIKVINVFDLVTKMEERTEWPIPTEDIMIKMASALHFDESESPYDYDDKYNNEVKIPAWKAAKVDNFFLFEHLKRPLGLPDISQSVLEGAMITVSEMDKLHLRKLKKVLQKAS